MVSAKEQMQFQKYMSNTAHVREIRDLQAAGLNPVLSAGGSGASTPTGAMDYSGGGGGSSYPPEYKMTKELVKTTAKGVKDAAVDAVKALKSNFAHPVDKEQESAFQNADNAIGNAVGMLGAIAGVPGARAAYRAASYGDKASSGKYYHSWENFFKRKSEPFAARGFEYLLNHGAFTASGLSYIAKKLFGR